MAESHTTLLRNGQSQSAKSGQVTTLFVDALSHLWPILRDRKQAFGASDRLAGGNRARIQGQKAAEYPDQFSDPNPNMLWSGVLALHKIP